MGGGWKSTTLSDLLTDLGFDADDVASCEPGDWFCVAHELVLERNGQPFAEKSKAGDGRRVLLGNCNGPNATMYPRSATVPEGVFHPPHSDFIPGGRCKLDKEGWVRFSRRVVVLAEHLDGTTYSCSEPEDSQLLADLRRARRL